MTVVTILTLDWTHATALDYDAALERLFHEFADDPLDVSVWRRDGDLEVTFVGGLTGMHAYDQGDAPSIAVDFDCGSLVLDRERFASAAYVEHPSAVSGVQRALRIDVGDREIEFKDV